MQEEGKRRQTDNVAKLTAENKALREELLNQWMCSHAEHCGRPVPPYPHKGCCWPMPRVLLLGDRLNVLQVQP
jgi:hypothetical protein